MYEERFMRRALALAEQAWGQTSPNPLVGAVLVQAGRVVGEGFHARVGAAHAEPLAIAQAARAGATHDLTLYVNLEPCAHHGRTPPCVDAVRQAPVRRVVAALLDPNPLVAGRGVAALRDAGIAVELGCCAAAAAELNHMFLARQLRQRPFVALKVALSADSCIATAAREPVGITGREARRHSHWLRAGHDAVLVGVETLLRDRPRLDRRLYEGPGQQPRRIVLDPRLRSLDFVWVREGALPLVFCDPQALDTLTRRGGRAALERRAQPIAIRSTADGFDPAGLVAALEGNEIWSLLVEGGGITHRRFLEQGLWDRVYVYRNPKLVLGGLHWEAGAAWEVSRNQAVAAAPQPLGDDLLQSYTHAAALPFGE